MENIYEKFDIAIENTDLLNTALTHSSYANENNCKSYERLEYLGDAVLEIVCSDYLYNNTLEEEGQMSRLRKMYVCENALVEYSKEINLEKYILTTNPKKPTKAIIADVFEATIAVVYLEKGLDAVKKIFNGLIAPHIESKDDFLMDYKSLLQESVQTVKKSVTYNLVEENGPANHKQYKSVVIIDDLVYGEGTGSSKKEAEQNAAKEAFNKRA